MAKKKRKAKLEPVDGLGPKELKQIRTALRQVWSWSRARRVAVDRAIGKDGFPRCEECKKKVPKNTVDHLRPCGQVQEPGFIERLFCSSDGLKAICNACHRKKTNAENSATRERGKEERWLRATGQKKQSS